MRENRNKITLVIIAYTILGTANAANQNPENSAISSAATPSASLSSLSPMVSNTPLIVEYAKQGAMWQTNLYYNGNLCFSETGGAPLPITLKALVESSEYVNSDRTMAKPAFDFEKINVKFREQIWDLVQRAKKDAQEKIGEEQRKFAEDIARTSGNQEVISKNLKDLSDIAQSEALLNGLLNKAETQLITFKRK